MLSRVYGFHKSVAASGTEDVKVQVPNNFIVKSVLITFDGNQQNLLQVTVCKGWNETYSEANRIVPSPAEGADAYVAGDDSIMNLTDLNIPGKDGEYLIVRGYNTDIVTHILNVVITVELL